jgi:hypothetical protein
MMVYLVESIVQIRINSKQKNKQKLKIKKLKFLVNSF